MTFRRLSILLLIHGVAWAQGPTRLTDVEAAQPEYDAAGERGASWRHGRLLPSHPAGGGLLEVASDGHVFASTNPTGDGTVLIWDQTHRASIGGGSPVLPGFALAEEVRFVLRGHVAPVLCMAFRNLGTPRSRWIDFATGSEDGTVRVQRLGIVGASAVIKDATDWVTGVGWYGPGGWNHTPGGWLVTGSLDGKARFYELGVDPIAGMKVKLVKTVDVGVPLTSLAVDALAEHCAVGDENGNIHVFTTPDEEPVVLRGHTEPVGTLEFNDHLLASGSNDHSIRLWNIKTLECTGVLRGHAGWVSDVTFSANQLVSASWDKSVRTWDLGTLREIDVVAWHTEPVVGVGVGTRGSVVIGTASRRSLVVWRPPSARAIRRLARRHRLPIYHAAMSANGQWLLTASVDHTAGVWEVATGRPVTRLRGHGGAVTFVAATRDGSRAATSSSDGFVRLWDLPSGQNLAEFEGHAEPVNTVAFGPTGRYLASGGRDDVVIVWDTVLKKRVRTFEGHEDDVKAVAWSPDGKTLASVSDDGTLRLWDAHGDGKTRVLKAHPAPLHTVAYRPDGGMLVTGSLDQTLKFWTADLKPVRTTSGFGRGVNTAEWNRAGTQVIVSSSDGKAHVIDAATGKVVHSLPSYSLACTWAGFDPGGHLAVTACIDGTVRQVALASGDVLRHHPADAGDTTAVAAAPDGAVYATHEDGRLRRWDAMAMRLVWETGGVAPLAAGHTEPVIASGTADGRVLLRRHPTGDRIRHLDVEARLSALAFADEDRALVGLTDAGALLRIPVDGAAAATPIPAPGVVICMAVDPEGHRVVVACEGGAIVILDIGSGKTLDGFKAAAEPTAIAWSPDGRWVLVGDEDGDIDAYGQGTRRGEQARLSGHSGPVLGIAFAGGHSIRSSIGRDGTVRTWNIDKALPAHGIVGRRGERPLCIATDPLGRFVVTGTDLGILVTDRVGFIVGSATAYDDRQWVSWRANRLYRSTPWVFHRTSTAWQPFPASADPTPRSISVTATWSPSGKPSGRRLNVRIELPEDAGTPLRDLRLLHIPTVSAKASVISHALCSHLPAGQLVVLQATILGDPKGMRFVVRHDRGTLPVTLPK